MGPLDSLFCIQAILVALVASGGTQLVKSVIDVVWGATHETPTPTVADALKLGGALRRNTLIINRLILPMTAPAVGFFFAALVALRPENLTHYVESHNIVGWQAFCIYGCWGGACGQFSDYFVSKVKDFLGTRREIRATMTPPPPSGTPAAEDHAP